MEWPGNPSQATYNYPTNFDPFDIELADYLVQGDCSYWNEPGIDNKETSSWSGKLIRDINQNTLVHATGRESSNNGKHEKGMKEKKRERGTRVAFRTKSRLEVMDDGYKWRKYGKKSVKNSPNPRNYYKCSSRDCGVKKRVERDNEDSNFVITTYEGIHSHPIPY